MKNYKIHYHSKRKNDLSKWFNKNKRILLIIIIILLFLLAYLIDRKIEKIDIKNIQEEEIENATSNYDAIITVLDGEGESTFTKVWGEMINEGYPICSDLVNDYIGKKGYMDWNTIEALNNVGIEFVFHSSSHESYENMSIEEIEKDINRGVKEMEDHGLEHRTILWRADVQPEKCEIGKNYFDCGFTNKYASDALSGDKSNPMMIQDYWCYNAEQYYTYNQLVALINAAIENNGWLVIFTRNNYLDEKQIDIYRHAFEYAKEHSVAVVTASEGYDLYYSNKLGNH